MREKGKKVASREGRRKKRKESSKYIYCRKEENGVKGRKGVRGKEKGKKKTTKKRKKKRVKVREYKAL